MASENTRERDLYSRVASYLRTAVGCSDTAIDTGLQLGRIDVIGVRGIGGDLSGEAETSAVEVKAGRQPFATSAGQADGYSVYAHRCYLVDLRIGRQPFNGNEIDIASRLGIGLLALRPKGVREVLSAPRNEPIERLNLELLEVLGTRVAQSSAPPSTGRVAPSAAPARSMTLWIGSGSRSGSACIPGRWRCEASGSVASPCTSAPGVAATGDGGDIVVSSTVKDLVAGSGLAFADRGEHELKGVPGTWRLFAVER